MVGGAGALVSGGGALVGGGEGALVGVNLVTTTIFVKNKNYKVKTIFNTSLVGRGPPFDNAKGGPRPTTFNNNIEFHCLSNSKSQSTLLPLILFLSVFILFFLALH